jgi:hypothetical protein
MGIFTPDLAKVDAGFPLYEKGMYRVKVTGRTPFVNEREDYKNPGTTKISAGIHYKLEMFGLLDEDNGEVLSTDGNGKEIRGKAVSRNSVYLHSQGGWSFSKMFLMAGLGWEKNEENEFNAWFQANRALFNFSGDPGDSQDVLEENMGEGWDAYVDRFVDVFLKKKVTTDDGVTREDQEFSAWQPVGDRAEL